MMTECTEIDDGIIISDKNGETLNLRKELDSNASAEELIVCNNRILIENCRYDEVSLSCIDFKKGITIKKSYIGKIYSTTANFGRFDDITSLDLIDTSFTTLELSNCTFYRDVDITYCRANKSSVNIIELEDCRINGNLYVRNLVLDKNGKVSLNGRYTNVMGDVEFRDCIILCGVLDIRTKIKGELRFYGINYRYDTQHQYLSHPHQSSIEFHESDINQVRFFNSKINRVSAENTIIDNILQQNTIIEILQKDAPRLFRDAAIKNNDDVLSLKYNGDVYDRHLKETSIGIIKNLIDGIDGKSASTSVHKSPKPKVSQILFRAFIEPVVLLLCTIGSSERIMLWLNKYSNDFNRSWVRGVWFTMIVTLIFYFILNYCGMQSPYFIIDFKFEGFDKVLLGYINMIDITCWKDSENIFNLTPIGGVIMFFAKLFIVYGVWQTIYAFYKYKK